MFFCSPDRSELLWEWGGEVILRLFHEPPRSRPMVYITVLGVFLGFQLLG